MTQEEMDKISDFISHAPSTIVVSVDENGYPRPVPVFKVKTEGIDIWFATRQNSQKMRDFEADTKSGMCFISGGDMVALRGEVKIIDGVEEKTALWKPMFEKMFPAGPTDPNLVFIKFTGNEATLFIQRKLEHVVI